ncbi:MAG TPA: hypothetical protein VII63_00665 [Caulobacteraceae bacterium]
MSFTLRQVTRRAAGGEIVRSRPIAASEPIIGRGADCDIHLTDLAVGLRHARLRMAGAHRVQIEALGELAVEVAGAFVRTAELPLAEAPEIAIGSHVLAFAQGAAADEVVVTVVRREDARARPATEMERAVFSPPATVFGKRRLAWSLGLGILVVCLALPAALFFSGHRRATIHADQQWSSGPLSEAHGFLNGNCQACHREAFVAVRDDACLACHMNDRAAVSILRVAAEVHARGSPFAPKLIGDHAAHGRLLAATPLPAAFGARVKALFERAFHHPNDRCASCHLEHIAAGRPGRAVKVVSTRPRATPFLASVNSCTDCHAGLNARLPTTALFDVPDWGRHPDFRPLLTVSAKGPRLERIALERRPIEHQGVAFSHRLHLDTAGGVARLAQVLGPGRGYGPPLSCANCHRPDQAGRSFQPVEMERDCSACHSLAFARSGGALRTVPHGSVVRVVAALEAFYGMHRGGAPASLGNGRRRPGLAAEIAEWLRRALAAKAPSARALGAIHATFAAGGICSNCHVIGRPKYAASVAYAVAPVRLTVRYLPRGGFDHDVPAHHQDAQGRLTCGVCHAARQSDRSEDVLLPRIAQCAACHGKAQAAQAAPAACAECHSYHAPGAPTSRLSVLKRDSRRPRDVRPGNIQPETFSWAWQPAPPVRRQGASSRDRGRG